MKDATEIGVVIDKSGSMSSKVDDVIGGFNEFLKEQQELPGEAFLTMVQFNTNYEVVCKSVPVEDVEPLDSSTYVVGGLTALNDAVGQCIDAIGGRLSGLDEKDRPDKVIIVIMTDGMENSSREYSLQRIKEMVTHQQEKYNWQFIFMGAGIDTFVGERMGIDPKYLFSVSNDSKGISEWYDISSRAVSNYRTSGKVDTGTSSND